MKPHKFKRMAIDLIERVQSTAYQVEYKYNIIWVWHYSDDYLGKIASINMHNNVDDDSTLLTKYEKAKKVLAGEALIDG
ncbi:TPA: hypothetical protein O4564_002613 [Staphylococcus aureus]|uniref:hypothetical protein n=1 Tax=Staphylococcus aureus TaxID=1280 RepID=UPI001CED1830|nr:hypothetical protein [Staphylococcus aureus]UCJ89557.1 hypothetical protein KU540_06135 [Staphylococcus aureus]UCJ95695.1 hypothetical protein KU505_10500 [Staphylococcus aureus]UCJ97922.1 hypothetical protein KU518_07455 [Staphylococcus aureus]HDA2408353.1 hypothetical protein [Staphylococcus aureus]HDA2699340.1 hypothetical protein [Staphylococcus aureus]